MKTHSFWPDFWTEKSKNEQEAKKKEKEKNKSNMSAMLNGK